FELELFHSLQNLGKLSRFPEPADQEVSDPRSLLLCINFLKHRQRLPDLPRAVELLDEIADEDQIAHVALRGAIGEKLRELKNLPVLRRFLIWLQFFTGLGQCVGITIADQFDQFGTLVRRNFLEESEANRRDQLDPTVV